MTMLPTVFLTAIAAGFVQGVTGFGSGLIMMVTFPTLLPMLGATALSSAISLSSNAGMTWTYRKHIRKELLLLPALCCVAAVTLTLMIADRLPSALLLKIFGGFLVVLAVYFLFFSSKAHVKASPVTASLCALLSGTCSALFSVGGPPMVLYYLACTDTKEAYIGTIQAYFFCTAVFTFILRIVHGYFTADLIVPMLIGMAGITLGNLAGRKVIDRININMLRKLVYIFLAVTGIVDMLK